MQEYTDFNSTGDYEQNSYESVNEYNPYLITGAALGGLGLLGYLGYSRYLKNDCLANKIIVRYGEKILEGFKSFFGGKAGKEVKGAYCDNKFWKWIDSCDDNTKKELLCNFLFVYTTLNCLPKYSNFNDYIIDLMENIDIFMYNFARTVNYIHNPHEKEEKLQVPNLYPLYTAILRMFGPNGIKTISEKFNNDENAIYVYKTCIQRLNEFVLTLNNDKDKAKYYSLLAYSIGLNLWKKLFPGRKFDEQEYLRLNEKLCIM